MGKFLILEIYVKVFGDEMIWFYNLFLDIDEVEERNILIIIYCNKIIIIIFINNKYLYLLDMYMRVFYIIFYCCLNVKNLYINIIEKFRVIFF